MLGGGGEGAAIGGRDLMGGGGEGGLGGEGAVQAQLQWVVNVLQAVLVLKVCVLEEETLFVFLAFKVCLASLTPCSFLLLLFFTLNQFITRV